MEFSFSMLVRIAWKGIENYPSPIPYSIATLMSILFIAFMEMLDEIWIHQKVQLEGWGIRSGEFYKEFKKGSIWKTNVDWL